MGMCLQADDAGGPIFSLFLARLCRGPSRILPAVEVTGSEFGGCHVALFFLTLLGLGLGGLESETDWILDILGTSVCIGLLVVSRPVTPHMS